jgi:hypothetical protein
MAKRHSIVSSEELGGTSEDESDTAEDEESQGGTEEDSAFTTPHAEAEARLSMGNGGEK